MPGPFVHNIDPIFGNLGGLYLWWYGLSYTLGFLGVFLWLWWRREPLGLSIGEVYSLNIFLAAGVLLGGRMVEVVFYEWEYYGAHPWHILAVWLGGMSTHGILLGAVLSLALFCRMYRRSFLEMADALAIPGAYIMGVGRIGNFIDGQIVGSVTEGWWGVKFPDAEEFRHPVVLYDGLKNLLLIPFLLLIRKTRPPRGVVVAHFILWYGFLRIFVDLFREYRTDLFGLPPGQEFNLLMAFVGVGLLLRCYKKGRTLEERNFSDTSTFRGRLILKQAAFTMLVLFPMIIPSDWTQDIPSRYGKRHEGLSYSVLYPKIASVPSQTND